MTKNGIEKLKRKIVFVSGLSFALVMIFIAALIYFGNLLVVNHEIHEVLDVIVENEGELPETGNRTSSFEKIQEEEDESALTSIGDEIANFFGIQGTFNSKEFTYSTRFFAVIFPKDASGPMEVKTSHIASVDDNQAVSIAERLRKRLIHFGRYESFYYENADLSGGRTIVVVMDCTSLVTMSRRILTLATFIIIVGIILSLLILRKLASKIAEPEIRNAENQKAFITNASHELKTPLAVIRANTEITEAMSGETEWTKATLRQVDRMQGLIQNLVQITRAQEQDSKEDRSDIDVVAAAKETVDTYQAVAGQEGLKLTTDFPESLHMVAEGGQIRQLISIFLDNATKYCDPGGTIHVKLSSAKRGKQTVLQVSNDYRDGATVDYSRFFDRFYREDKSHNTDRGGYGIGLSIAESIVEQYRGSADASWKDGRITFTCRLYS